MNHNLSILQDTKGQVSAELILVIAALLAVAAVMIGQLNNTAKTGKVALSNKTNDTIGALNAIPTA